MVNIMGLSDFIPPTSEIYKEFSVNDTIVLDCPKPDIERLISSAFDVKIISVRVIDTPAGQIPPKGVLPGVVTSSEGERLTGKKLVVEMKFRQKIQYVADEPQQSIHGVHNEFTVSEFIVIPPIFTVGGECVTAEYLLTNNMFFIYPFIEDANVNMVDNRSICTNILIFMQVNIKKCLFDKGVITGPIGNVTTFNNSCASLKESGKETEEVTEEIAEEVIVEDVKKDEKEVKTVQVEREEGGV